MTIILDTIKKTVAVKEEVSISELITELKAILPDGLWEDLILVPYVEKMVVEHNVIISNPIQYVTPPVLIGTPGTGAPLPNYPWITCGGVYQIDTTFTPADSLLLDD